MYVHILKASEVNFRLPPLCIFVLLGCYTAFLYCLCLFFLFNDAVSVSDGRVISYGMCRMNCQLIYPRCVALDHNMGEVQSGTTCSVYIAKRFFYIACLNNYMFRPFIGHHQVVSDCTLPILCVGWRMKRSPMNFRYSHAIFLEGMSQIKKDIYFLFFSIVVPCILITSRFFSPTNALFY